MLREDDIIILLYCAISDVMGEKDFKHSQSSLWLSEIVLIGSLAALKGGSFRQFYAWLWRRNVFELPDRTRLSRLLKTHRRLCQDFLGRRGLFNVMDTFGIEIIRPIREFRSYESTALAWKGKSGHRWIVGRKICVCINGDGEIVAFAQAGANVSDKVFNAIANDPNSITLADAGFKDKRGIPATMKICKRGEWNVRMNVETLFSLWDRVCNVKRMCVKTLEGFITRVTYLVTLTNLTQKLNKTLGFPPLTMVQYAL